MWFITETATGRILFIKKSKTSLGRLKCDCLITGDDSLSRHHVTFLLTDEGLKLKDEKSKYGTFLNDDGTKSHRLNDQPVALKDGDIILFGMFTSEWIVCQLEFKVALSMLNQREKSKTVKVLDEIKAQQVESFDETCSHLTMSPQTKISIKLLEALSLCTPVVTPNFWVAVQESIKNDKTLPNCNNFLPAVKEELCLTPDSVSLKMLPERKKIFTGKNFIFVASSQFREYQQIIKNAGGKCSSLSQNKLHMREFLAPNIILVRAELNSETQTQTQDAVKKLDHALATKKRRMVQVNEISMAILHCSIERFCNPSSAIESLFTPTESLVLKVTKSKILIPETDSFDLQAPSTSGLRNPAKKVVTAEQTVATINLDSDNDDDVNIFSSNKENIIQGIMPNSNFLIPETQLTNNEEPSLDEPFKKPIEYFGIPETQIKVVSTESEDKPNATENSDCFNDSSRSSVELDKQSFEFAVLEVSNAPIVTSSLFNFINSNSSKNTLKIQRKRKISEKADESSSSEKRFAPSTSTDVSKLFNFTDDSIGSELPSLQRKRKVSEIVEAPETSESDSNGIKNPKPSLKRSKKNLAASDDVEKPESERPSRKRAQANTASNNLFEFNMNFVKKTKQTESTSRAPSRTVSGIVPIMKPLAVASVKKLPIRYESDDSCDSGVWLSKALLSVKLNESDKEIKTEPTEQNLSLASNKSEIKQELYESVFNIHESSINASSISSIASKRKQFVKKQNFKQRTSIVTMGLVNLRDTHSRLDLF